MAHPPVVVVESGAPARVQVAEGVNAPARTVAESGAPAIMLVESGAPPVALFNPDGTPYEGVGYTFVNAEAEALVARFTTPPTTARMAMIDTLVGSLKTAGVWSKLDALYIMAAADAQAAQRNWVQDLYNLTPVNTPAFVADRGYTGNGTTSYLDTGFNPATAASPKFVQNSASLSVWSRTPANATQAMGNSNNTILPSSAGNAVIRVNNGGSASSGANVDSDGFFIANRSVSNAETLRRNGVSLISSSAASTGIDSSAFRFCARAPSSFSTIQEASGHIGQSLSTTEQDDMYAAIDTYMEGLPGFF